MTARSAQMIRWNVRCHDCGHRGFAYVLAGDSYGRQLGRTSHHQLAEFNSWEDPSFDEVAELVHEMMRRSQGQSDSPQVGEFNLRETPLFGGVGKVAQGEEAPPRGKRDFFRALAALPLPPG